MKPLYTPTAVSAKAAKRTQARVDSLREQSLQALAKSSRDPRPAGTYSIRDLERRFREMGLRASIRNQDGRGEEVKAYFDECIEALHSEEALKDRGEIIAAAMGGDSEAQVLRAEAIIEQIRMFIMADSGWSNFFESRTLGDEDFPAYEVSVPQEILVEAIGTEGFPITVQPIQDKKVYPVPLELFWTEWFEYPLRDLYKGGKVKDLALMQIDLERDFMHHIEGILAGYILAGAANSRLTANFDITNADLKLRDFLTHSRVVTGNLPTGNLVELSGNDATTNFRKEVLDAALAYCEQFGNDVDESGPLRVTSIRVAGRDIGAWRDQVTLTSESNSLTEQIFAGGAVINYAGQRFTLEADNTIDPADGMAYVQLNKPVGVQFEKTSFANVLIDESPERVRENKGRICQGSAYGWMLPRQMRKNVLGIRYRDEA